MQPETKLPYNMANVAFPTTGLSTAQSDSIQKAQEILKTANTYAGQAGGVSSLSSTDGAKTVQDIKNQTTTPPPPTDPKTGQPTVPAPVNPVDTLTAQTIQKELDAQKTQAEKDADSAKALWDSLVPTSDLSVQKKSQIDNIKNTYAAARTLLEESNRRTEKTIETAGIRSGTARYSPEIQAGIMASEERASATRIADLNAKEQSAINDIEQAFTDKEYTLGVQKYQALQGIQDKKNTAIKDAQEKASEQLKKLQERNTATTRDIAISDLMASGITDPNKIAQELKNRGITGTAKEIGDAFTSLIPPKVAQTDISADERIFKQMKADGILSADTTMFDFWKKKDEAMRDPKSVDPLLQTIRELAIQSKVNEMNGFLMFTPKDKKEFDYADGFRMAVSDAPQGQAKQRGITFSNFMEKGEYKLAREYIFKTALETAGVDDYRQIGGAANVLQSVNQFDTLLTEMQKAGIPTNIISGTAEEIARKLGQSTNPSYVYFRGRVQNTLQNYRRAMTGVAFSPTESAEYEKQFPTYKNDISVNRKINQAITDSLKLQVDGFYTRKLGEDMYNKLASEGVSDAFGTSSNTPQKVNIMGQDIEVGSIVKNKKTGVQGRVEVDGTITPIQ